MIRAIHQRTNLCKSSLSSECMNLIKAKFKKNNSELLSFPISGCLVTSYASWGSEQSLRISHKATESFIHSTNIYRARSWARCWDSNTNASSPEVPAYSVQGHEGGESRKAGPGTTTLQLRATIDRRAKCCAPERKRRCHC